MHFLPMNELKVHIASCKKGEGETMQAVKVPMPEGDSVDDGRSKITLITQSYDLPGMHGLVIRNMQKL